MPPTPWPDRAEFYYPNVIRMTHPQKDSNVINAFRLMRFSFIAGLQHASFNAETQLPDSPLLAKSHLQIYRYPKSYKIPLIVPLFQNFEADRIIIMFSVKL